MVYIENGYAKVATLPYVHRPDQLFEYQYTIAEASEVACDFDGRFELITDRTGIYFDTEIIWSLVTFGEPYIAIVNNAGVIIWQNQTAIVTLANTDVVKVSILRGWKSVNEVLTDQGVICAYTKTDGKMYYRAYCEQEGGSFIWELEHEITEFVPPVTNLALFRAADYRTGFLAEIAGDIQMLLTIRSWSGMAILPEKLSIDIQGTLEVFNINYLDNFNRENIEIVNIEGSLINLYGLAPEMVIVENINNGSDDYGYYIRILWDEAISIQTTLPSCFALTDAGSGAWGGQSISQNGRYITIGYANFNNLENPATITYTPGSIIGDIELAIGQAFEFTASNLVPFVVPPPIPVSAENIEEEVPT